MRKIIALGIMLLFLGMTISSSTGLNLEKQSTIVTLDGNTLYVGGNGTGNYSKIQDAIDNASDGDTVFVHDDSSPYYENLIVDKSITLKGENKETTVINGSDSEIVVNISSDNVILSGFTVLNHGNYSSLTSILVIHSNYNIISGNIITGNAHYGIDILYSEYSIISGNTITSVYTGIGLYNKGDGILLFNGENNNISGNIIKDCSMGIELIWFSNNNSIFGNTLTNNTWGISTKSINDVISLNNISYNFYGISILNCFNYKITRNNFIGNNWSAHFTYSLFFAYQFGHVLKDIRSTIKWDGNYWNRPRSFPKPILGELPPYGIVPWFQFDLHPAQEPYDIGV